MIGSPFAVPLSPAGERAEDIVEIQDLASMIAVACFDVEAVGTNGKLAEGSNLKGHRVSKTEGVLLRPVFKGSIWKMVAAPGIF